MKIALIHIRYIYKGGLESRLFNYIDYFLKRGDEVHLFTSKISPDITPPPSLHIHLINLKHIFKPVRNFFFDKKLKKVLKRNEFDFILSLERTSRQFHVIAPSTHKGYMVAKKSFIYDPIDWIQIYLDKKSFKNAKVVYACSEMVKQEAVTYYKIYPHRIKVLYPPINLSKFKPAENKAQAKQKMGLDPQKKYFLLVSTSHKRKGLDLLLNVFKDLPPEYVLLVAGTEFSSPYPNIKSLGFVMEMNEVYQAADCLLHPAVYEPFGQIVTEAFACHVPAFVSENVGAKELTNHLNGKIIASFTTEDWRQAIVSFQTENYSFANIDETLESLDLDHHMKKMMEWAIIRK